MRMPKVGEAVVFHDPMGEGHDALATAVWSETCINLVFVSGDEARKDGFGRQIERDSSVTHVSVAGAHGNYWRFSDEEEKPYTPPVEG